MNIILLISGFILLIKSADIFVDGSSNIAKVFGLSPLIIGLTIVSIGTSAPETAINITSSIRGINDISLGNVLGSNICNILLVLGFGSLFGNIHSKKETIRRDFPVAIYSSLLLLIPSVYFFNRREAEISRVMGIVFLISLIAYLYLLLASTKRPKEESKEKIKFNIKYVIFVILGIIGIVIGGDVVVNASVNLATNLGISESVIALSMIALGTSLPELATTVVAIKKKEPDIAIGNIIGSNILNILLILGLSSTINPIKFGIDSLFDIIVVLISTIYIYIVFLKKKKLTMNNGVFMLLMYFVYMLYIFFR